MPYPGSSTYPGSTTYPGTDGPVTTTSSLRLGIGRSFVRTAGTGGGGVTPGPTVQIARSPTSVSAATNATGTLTKTPEDASGVSTGAASWWHSSDPTKLRIDDATTGAWTWLGSAGQTAYAYADPNVPSSLSEPIYAGTGGQTPLLITDLSEYTGMSLSDMQTYALGATNSDRRLYPSGAAPYCQLVTGLDGTGTALKIVGTNDEDGFFSYGDFLSYPPSPPGSGATHYPTHFITYDGTLTQAAASGGTHNPVGYATRVKWLMGWHFDMATRAQWNTTDLRPAGAPSTTVWGQGDQGFSISPSRNAQVRGPWFDDIKNDGVKHRFAHQWRTNTADPGTVDVLIQEADVLFSTDMTGTLHLNDYITLLTDGSRPQIPVGTALSAAEFKITAFAGQTAHVVRQGTTGHTLTSYGNGVNLLRNVTTVGVFSVSRAGSTVASGRPIALDTASVFQVDSFDGTTGCTITQLTPDDLQGNAIQRDFLSRQYSTILDGISRMWIDGFLIHDTSLEAVGVTPSGGVEQYCYLSDISLLKVNDGIWQLLFGGAQSQGPSYSMTVQNIKWWAVNV